VGVRTVLLAALALTFMTTLAPVANAQPSDVTKLAIIGDSITDGYGAAAGQGYADLLESNEVGDNVLKLAVGGATVKRWLPGGPHYSMLDQITTWQPATVLVNLGTNDHYIARRPSEYQAQLGQLIAQIRARAPGARVILWHQFGGYFKPDPALCDIAPCLDQVPPAGWKAFGDAMRAAAIANYAGYIDDSVAQTWNLWLLPDKAHPNTTGHIKLHASIRARLLACC
jgi:lysophospholipase L1-like esterase